ncbi:hypothetical protein CYLTODRAFT_447669 [Cylindrobasidium torrendii FP15055 ss-10]|uniref:Uncharacterized protein n=1 Tax=Cylindrobasidium torrendii FP15055 ss-10 TaxID=1314674 RepID=A0A0D7AUJ7_9AGAR|nr:hypothetical protein CYLTODRAFT_447669 [Cylindrobasidium torrendii FP15055 ss-10]
MSSPTTVKRLTSNEASNQKSFFRKQLSLSVGKSVGKAGPTPKVISVEEFAQDGYSKFYRGPGKVHPVPKDFVGTCAIMRNIAGGLTSNNPSSNTGFWEALETTIQKKVDVSPKRSGDDMDTRVSNTCLTAFLTLLLFYRLHCT